MLLSARDDDPPDPNRECFLVPTNPRVRWLDLVCQMSGFQNPRWLMIETRVLLDGLVEIMVTYDENPQQLLSRYETI
jgi:alkylation response protein AidB-like acyl-CoA dehydrogenase